MSMMQQGPIRIPPQGVTYQLADQLHVTHEDDGVRIIIDTLGNPDSRFTSDGLSAQGLEVWVEVMRQFDGESYPVLRRPVLIHSDDVETLLELAEGLALLPNPSDYDAIRDRIISTLHTLSSAPEEGIDAEEWMEFCGKVGEIYVLRDVLLECDDAETMELSLNGASFFDEHVHDWEPEYSSVADVKTSFQNSDLDIYISSREQIDVDDSEAHLILLSFRRCGPSSTGAITFRELVEGIENLLGPELYTQIECSDYMQCALNSDLADIPFMLRASRPPCVIRIHDLPGREQMLAMDWDRHPNLGQPIRLTGHEGLNANAYQAVISSLSCRGDVDE
jgi:hypothetical protein